ncbi:hypothetical protein ACMFMF_010134 [Clarireedia jacksonii]
MVGILTYTRTSWGGINIGLPDSTTSDGQTFLRWLRAWNFSSSSRGALVRKIFCVLALVMHLPLSFYYSFSAFPGVVGLILGGILSLFNLWCMGVGLHRLDVMRGERKVWKFTVGRQGFDFVIVFLLFVWGSVSAYVFSGALDSLGGLYYFVLFLFPALVFADVLCYVAGYVTTWERQGGVILG